MSYDTIYPHPSWIEIDLAQFKKNLSIIRLYLKEKLFCLPIKANAYGHGLCQIGKAAVEAGVDYLGVAHLQEGVELRKSGITIPILVLGAIHEDQILDLLKFNLEFAISSKYKADLVAQKLHGKQERCKVHIEIDTGMQRTGVRPTSALTLYNHLQALQCFEIVGVYSHLASSDLPNSAAAERQIEIFTSLVSTHPFNNPCLLKHMANSGGVAHYPLSLFDMVRPSLLSLGYLPPNVPPFLKGIAPCFTLKSKISYFKVVLAGEGIGYGHTHVTSQQTRVVTIPVGYGDGYRHALSNKGHVLIRGRRYPIVGKVCMDQCMVDIGTDEAYVGDEVVLIGKQGNEEISLQEVSELCSTIPYEILCLFNQRIPRFYKN